MSKIVQIKIFNDVLDQFLDYLENNFSFFKSDIIFIKSTVEFIRKSNPRLVVEQYMDYAGPYKDFIFNCDENFFLNLNLQQSGLNIENQLFGNKIRNIWLSTDINDNQKAHIWLYFHKLLKAGTQCTQS
jgi:hypothetical protein